MTLAEIRAAFPHVADTVYLNHAATGPLSTPVMEVVEGYLQDRHRGAIENYLDVLPRLEEAKRRVARVLSVAADRVAFVPNTSYGLSLLAEGLDWQPGDRVAVPGCEFPANVVPFLNLQRLGVETDLILHREGTFGVEDVERSLTPRTRVVSVSWVQFLSGFRADLPAIGRLCRDRGVLFCVDAIQGAGALTADAPAWGADLVASGGHKWLMAMQGCGFAYVSDRAQAQIASAAGWLSGPIDWDDFFDYGAFTLHPSAARYELGTVNTAGLLALGTALELYQRCGPAWCERQVLARSRQLADGLERLGLRRYGSEDPAHASGIVTVRHPEPDALVEHLHARRIVASVRNRMVRFAPTYYNSADEVGAALDAVRAFGRVAV